MPAAFLREAPFFLEAAFFREAPFFFEAAFLREAPFFFEAAFLREAPFFFEAAFLREAPFFFEAAFLREAPFFLEAAFLREAPFFFEAAFLREAPFFLEAAFLREAPFFFEADFLREAPFFLEADFLREAPFFFEADFLREAPFFLEAAFFREAPFFFEAAFFLEADFFFEADFFLERALRLDAGFFFEVALVVAPEEGMAAATVVSSVDASSFMRGIRTTPVADNAPCIIEVHGVFAIANIKDVFDDAMGWRANRLDTGNQGSGCETMPCSCRCRFTPLHMDMNEEQYIVKKAANCSLPRRLAAILYDSIVLIALLFFAALPPTFLHGEGMTGTIPTLLMRIYLLAIAFVFFGGFWTHGGQTIGMRAWHIRVVDMEGNCIGWRRALARFAFAIVSWAAAGIGFWWSLLDREGLTWHDRASATRLVHMPRNRRARTED